MDFGRAIRIVRAARGTSQKKLAEVSELDPSYISLIEKGKRQPSTDALKAISQSLEIPMSLLTLLASGSSDLKGISEEQAETLGKLLMNVLLDAERSVGNHANERI